MNENVARRCGLSEAELEGLRRDIDELRARVQAQLGEADVEHIRTVRAVARALEVSGRLLIHFSLEPVSWSAGVLGLGLYKILENMEIGHNVLHGQYDFAADPSLHSESYDWDMVPSARIWKRAHNATHHVFTNVIGRDDDFGYTSFRFSSEMVWNPSHFLQPLTSVLSALGFQYSVALYDLRLPHYLVPRAFRSAEIGPRRPVRELVADLADIGRKALRLNLKEYVLFPALAGPLALKVLAGNLAANALRNVWAYAVIYCGHLTEQADTFSEADLSGESRGGYYLRQLRGSSNFEAGPLLGVLSGHLSHQIEHHLFPDVPAWRLRSIAPEVRRICEKYGIAYNSASFGTQLKSVARRLLRHAVPGSPAPVGARGDRAARVGPPVESSEVGRRGAAA